MGWILFGLFLVLAFGRGVSHAGKSKDDFAGNSMDSFFLLEEFIDAPGGEENEPDQAEQFLERGEEDWFKEEW